MKRIILQKIPLPVQMKMGFVQNIMGKYGMSRGRDPFQALILRKYRMLFTEPVVSKASFWAYSSIYNPAQQIIASPHSGSHILTMTSNIIKVTNHSSFVYLPLNPSSEQGISKFKYSSSLIREVQQERVRGHREIAQSINVYQPVHSDLLKPVHIDLEGPQYVQMIPNEVKSQVINQMKTVQAYTSYKAAAAFSIDRPLTPKQEVQYERNRQAVSPTIALEKRNEAARDIGELASRAEHSTASLSNMSMSSVKSPESLRLVLGKGIDSVLGNIKAYYDQTEAINQSGGVGIVQVISYAGLQNPTKLQKTTRLQEQAQLKGMTRLLDRLKHLSAIPAQAAVKRLGMARLHNSEILQGAILLQATDGIHHDTRLPFPPSRQERQSSRSSVIAPGEPEQTLPAISVGSSLIFRRSESKAADLETTQKPQETQHQHREALFQANPAPKQPKNKLNIGTEELSLLAERVFQVLDKRMSIRKDRRGLR